MVNSQRFLLVCFMWLASSTVVFADDHPAKELVETTTQELLSTFKTEKEAIDADPNVLREIVQNKIIGHFDFIRMSKLALGKHWRKASVEQRKEFATQFRQLLLNTYAKALYRFADAEIEYDPVRTEEGARYVDVVSAVNNGGEPVSVTYRLHEKKEAWKVFNITIEGVSLITNFRSTFTSFINKKGIDALNLDLAKRNEKAAKGELEDEPA